ncbi:hypothetical protein ACIQW9_13900 [Herminiimonas sp. NPDC097707]
MEINAVKTGKSMNGERQDMLRIKTKPEYPALFVLQHVFASA